jgi:penicillin V acylase-like amidase (Ntn superfamily)
MKAMLFCSLLGLSTGCSNFYMRNDYRLSVRTMDLGTLPLHAGFSLMAVPRGKIENNPLAYLSFNPSEGRFDLERFATGGMNEAGLSCDMQTLEGSEFPQPDPSSNTTVVQVEYFCQWILSKFQNVAGLQEGLPDITVVDASGSFGNHFIARDKLGHSLAMEFMGGELKLYYDLNDDGKTGFGIFTNEPTLDYHIKNIQHLQWKRGLARQAVSIPGTRGLARQVRLGRRSFFALPGVLIIRQYAWCTKHRKSTKFV